MVEQFLPHGVAVEAGYRAQPARHHGPGPAGVLEVSAERPTGFQDLSSPSAHAAGTVTFEDHAQTVRLMNDSGFLFKGATLYSAGSRRPT
jgi:hypothetical protein